MFYLSLICFYTLCYFENDFCLKFVHGEQFRLNLRNRSSKIVLKNTSFFLLHLFTVLKMISLCANCSTAKNNSKKTKEKTTMKTHRLMSSVREKAGLLKLLLCLAFLFFGLLKQVNIAVESKTIGVIFPPFFRFSDFFAPVGQKFSSKNLYRRIH